MEQIDNYEVIDIIYGKPRVIHDLINVGIC